MNPSGKDHLLREILAEDSQLAELRRTSLALGLETVRGKRCRRRALQVCLALALAGAFGIGLIHRPSPPPYAPEKIVVAPVAVSPGVKIISEKELFALFPDRPLALIGKPGQQRLVFLDAEAANNDSRTKPPGSRLTE